MTTKHSTGNRADPVGDRGDDLYETPTCATLGLIDARPDHFMGFIWEPCCGPGAIARVLRGLDDVDVTATDLIDYGWDGQDASRADFLMEHKGPWPPNWPYQIVTNPPFKLATEMIAHAVFDLRAPGWWLLRTLFLAGGSEETKGRPQLRASLREHLTDVLQISPRLPAMYRGGEIDFDQAGAELLDRLKANEISPAVYDLEIEALDEERQARAQGRSAMDFAWFRFQPEPKTGPTRLEWINCRRFE